MAVACHKNGNQGMPPVMIFGGVIGGLLTFGTIGLFIGPVVLAVAQTLGPVWICGGERYGERER